MSEEVIELRVYQRRDRIDGHGCVPVVDSEENEGRVFTVKDPSRGHWSS